MNKWYLYHSPFLRGWFREKADSLFFPGTGESCRSEREKISLMMIYSFITGQNFLPKIPTLETITYSFDKTTIGFRRPVASTWRFTIKMALTLQKEQIEAVRYQLGYYAKKRCGKTFVLLVEVRHFLYFRSRLQACNQMSFSTSS